MSCCGCDSLPAQQDSFHSQTKGLLIGGHVNNELSSFSDVVEGNLGTISIDILKEINQLEYSKGWDFILC